MTIELPEVTGGPTWIRKMRTLFRRLDTSGHGYLMVDDILEIGTSLFNIYPKMLSYKYDELVKTLVYLWYDVICIHVPRQLATTITINENLFIENLLKSLKGELHQNFNEKFIEPLFNSIDQDNDQLIISSEFQSLMISWKSIPKDCELIFRYYSDKNKLSKENFLKIFIDFFILDNSKSNINQLWGLLINYKRAEDYGTIDCGPVWESKIRTMYRRLDINETMKLRCHDLLQIGQFLIQRTHLDRRRADAVMRAMLHIWVKFLAIDKNGAEDYGTIDCGPVWESKIRTMYRRLDINETMKLRCHDLLQIGQFLIQRTHLDRRRADAVMRAMLHIWVKFLAIDKNGEHLDEIREIEFVHNMREMINGEYRHEIDQFGWTFFKAIEIDNSGYISQASYRILQEAWHVGRDEAEAMFKILDTDKDGKISSDEFLTAWNDYFLSEDPQSPYRMFFGPVISRPTEAR
ncbi:putative sarcoplasmic calcium-binding protein (SCP) [Schistosoma mansoni]|uniref:putative sarcoplasmic calcium-binding protein (SCP) n=1 Tax=Schistosoma mansoni TaxID=6183 RepID=UPI00022DC397|nr:putative sarcoplasmic calcium-binding protein (SCP) [Schistosoma mansoni]|eukprot:XP_018652914.1 putative sarcoplasmic calcium-binding protein (SCP) [Schistosoma mansoni]